MKGAGDVSGVWYGGTGSKSSSVLDCDNYDTDDSEDDARIGSASLQAAGVNLGLLSLLSRV
jgi:hypothetical protein